MKVLVMKEIAPDRTTFDTAYNAVVSASDAYKDALSILRQLQDLYFDCSKKLDETRIATLENSIERRKVYRNTALLEHSIYLITHERYEVRERKTLAEMLNLKEEVKALEQELVNTENLAKSRFDLMNTSPAINEEALVKRRHAQAEAAFNRIAPIVDLQIAGVAAAEEAFHEALEALAHFREEPSED